MVKKSSHLSYVAEPIDAATTPRDLVAQYQSESKTIFRLYSLVFHHFDDNLASKILKNTLETSDGFE